MKYIFFSIAILWALNVNAQNFLLPSKYSACRNTQMLSLNADNTFEYRANQFGKTDGFVSAEIYKGTFEYDNATKSLKLKVSKKYFKKDGKEKLVKSDKRAFILEYFYDKTYNVYCFTSPNKNCNFFGGKITN